MRIGHGFDTHRFQPGRRLVLGGVDVPYEMGMEAHSDGDVVIHALCDALLGAAALGDLNAVLTESRYDHENRILIGMSNGKRYAFRPHEIQLGGVPEPDRASEIVDEVVDLVNRVWQEREGITPSTKERDLPTVIEIFQLLPRTNCRECGFVTCLACAADIRSGAKSPEDCPALAKPEYAGNREQLLALFSS